MSLTITPYLLYEDVDAAIGFLQSAFGFEEVMRSTGPGGDVDHAELRLGDGTIYLGDPGGDYRNPARLGTATVLVTVDGLDDVDALHERARDAGAEITEPPLDQDYGARRFAVRDPEGHGWFFSQPLG